MLGGFGGLGLLMCLVRWWRADDGALLDWTGDSAQIAALCFWGAGVALWVVSRLASAVCRPVYVGWMTITVPIGIAVSTMLLSALYFVLLPVFSLIVRAGDPLRKKLSGGPKDTYWEDHPSYEPTLERMGRLF